MFRIAPFILLAAACVADEAAPADVSSTESALSISFTRQHVAADIYHYEAVVPLGTSPNARLRIHRVVREVAPFVPRHTRAGVMALHGDFSTFDTNFLPGLAPYLAARDIDVWGVDRRWTVPGASDDVSDFATMGVAQEVDDVRRALAIARTTRVATGSGGGPLALLGFSHGGQLAYTYAANEAARPGPHHVSALAIFDYYGDLDDASLRASACASADFEDQLVADGQTDGPNDFLITVGTLALSDPGGTSPFFDPATNRDALLMIIGQTYLFAPFTPWYHLAAPILDAGAPVGLRESTETAMGSWLASATPHESMREAADFDRLLCGEGVQPIDAPLSNIEVPLLYVGAAGGIGAMGLHATSSVSSTDVTRLMIHRFGADRVTEDVGHTDLLLGTDAPTLAWQPLATWLLHH